MESLQHQGLGAHKAIPEVQLPGSLFLFLLKGGDDKIIWIPKFQNAKLL